MTCPESCSLQSGHCFIFPTFVSPAAHPLQYEGEDFLRFVISLPQRRVGATCAVYLTDLDELFAAALGAAGFSLGS